MGCALMTVFLPCKPPLLGSFLLCGQETASPIWTPLLALFELVMFMKSLICGAHYGLFFHISGQVLFLGRCQELVSSKNMEVGALVKGYRQLQVWEKIHNSSYRGRILLISIFAIPMLQILSGFGVITLFHNANLFQIFTFLVTYLDAVVFGLAISTFASTIYVKSEGWIRNVKPRSGKNARYLRRVHKSFRPLRLELGNNFVDGMTPLVMQEFCISQTASLVLLDRV